MSPGDTVEVNLIWAQSPKGPLKAWAKGYRFVRQDGESVIVAHVGGIFDGIEVRYPARDVRTVS